MEPALEEPAQTLGLYELVAEYLRLEIDLKPWELLRAVARESGRPRGDAP